MAYSVFYFLIRQYIFFAFKKIWRSEKSNSFSLRGVHYSVKYLIYSNPHVKRTTVSNSVRTFHYDVFISCLMHFLNLHPNTTFSIKNICLVLSILCLSIFEHFRIYLNGPQTLCVETKIILVKRNRWNTLYIGK